MAGEESKYIIPVQVQSTNGENVAEVKRTAPQQKGEIYVYQLMVTLMLQGEEAQTFGPIVDLPITKLGRYLEEVIELLNSGKNATSIIAALRQQ